MCRNRKNIGWFWSLVATRNKRKEKKILRVRLGPRPGGLLVVSAQNKRKNKRSPFGLYIVFVAHWVLGAHMVCFKYRVEVQKYL